MRRNHARQHYETTILFSKKDNNQWHNATMHNISIGGMYFESEHSLPQGERILIKFTKHTTDILMSGASRVFQSKTRWCKRIPGKKEPLFGIGVQFNKHQKNSILLENFNYCFMDNRRA